MSGSTLPSNAFFGIPEVTSAKATKALDINGNPLIAKDYISSKPPNDRSMVQGLKGEPSYLLLSSEGSSLERYALNAECTHLGCVVPWNEYENKFVCPCHGSRYDSLGVVLRGPAPQSLQLAHVDVSDETGEILIRPWDDEVDFRTNEKPWWN
eukprot:CAMPEP_0195519288 /NCGR_PEP_ID=MMETSP0794_2-20130614/14559_1 /TAXON_ID=515487 /ORGANISM="Stephanopyxis turris, Strain CCMP 815" /LENGTH=152 /DNA_ID=CAMNT_0040648413 /DNA_START=126 /DNA_END=584 /DNA_ORIENTATION=-